MNNRLSKTAFAKRPNNPLLLGFSSMGSGTGPDCVFSLETNSLPSGLKYLQDKPKHGVIMPTRVMPVVEYQALLASTAQLWKKVCP